MNEAYNKDIIVIKTAQWIDKSTIVSFMYDKNVIVKNIFVMSVVIIVR